MAEVCVFAVYFYQTHVQTLELIGDLGQCIFCQHFGDHITFDAIGILTDADVDGVFLHVESRRAIGLYGVEALLREIWL